MNTYTVRVYCDRQGVEVEETVVATEPITLDAINQLRYQAEEQHCGQCGNKNEPCMAEANSYEVDSHRVEDIWGETYWIDHMEVWFDHTAGDWCADAVDENGDYIPQTAEWSATRKLAIERSLFNFPNIDIQVFNKNQSFKKLWTIKGVK